MSYTSWYNEHANKHKLIVDKLVAKNYSKEQIIDYFDFESMVKNEPGFCPLYAENKKCHNMKSLNCYLCACPNFRFKDEGIEKVEDKTKYSFCSIASKDGKIGVYGNAIHQDCSGCTVPHHKEYVSKHFDLDWRKIMKDVII
jgi:Zn-finger protein